MDSGGPAKLRRTERFVDREIRELEQSGELRGLPGEGRPFAPDPDAAAGDSWAARHLVRTAQARPAWVQLRGEIAERRARIIARSRAHLGWLDRRQALLSRTAADRIVDELATTQKTDVRIRAELANAVEELSGLVRRYNLHVPSVLQLPLAAARDLLEIARAVRR